MQKKEPLTIHNNYHNIHCFDFLEVVACTLAVVVDNSPVVGNLVAGNLLVAGNRLVEDSPVVDNLVEGNLVVGIPVADSTTVINVST